MHVRGWGSPGLSLEAGFVHSVHFWPHSQMGKETRQPGDLCQSPDQTEAGCARWCFLKRQSLLGLQKVNEKVKSRRWDRLGDPSNTGERALGIWRSRPLLGARTAHWQGAVTWPLGICETSIKTVCKIVQKSEFSEHKVHRLRAPILGYNPGSTVLSFCSCKDFQLWL